MKIQIGEFWLVNGGDIFKVKELPKTKWTRYVGSKIKSNGCFVKKSLADGFDFNKKITPQIAEDLVKVIMKNMWIDNFSE